MSTFSGGSRRWFPQETPVAATGTPSPNFQGGAVFQGETVFQPPPLIIRQQQPLPVAPPAEPKPDLIADTFPGWTQQVERGKTHGVFTKTMVIDPKLAALILGNNPKNRKLSTHYGIPRVKRALLNGTWQHNGETIKVATTGELNDGQNRLHACIETGIPIKTEVTFGLTRESRATVDTGVVRNVHHVLDMNEVPYASAAALAVGIIIAFQNGRTRFDLETQSDRPAPHEVLAWIKEHPDIIDDLREANAVYQRVKVSRGVMAALHYLFRQRDPDATKLMFTRLIEGLWDGINAHDPVFRLREHLRNHLYGRRQAKAAELAALAIQAFNAMRQGQRLPRHRWTADSNEPFPTIL